MSDYTANFIYTTYYMYYMCECKSETMRDGISHSWLRTMRSLFGTPTIERTRIAIVSVETSISHIQMAEDKIKNELCELSMSLRQTKTAKQNIHSAATETLLRRSRAKRQQLSSLHKKHLLLDGQRDTLLASDLNQQVFSSMQNTSLALKSMGLDKTLESVDEVMQDISDSNSDVRSIQEGLSSDNISYCDISSQDLMEEMRMLMEDDLDSMSLLTPPNTSNKMKQESTPMEIEPPGTDAQNDSRKTPHVLISQSVLEPA